MDRLDALDALPTGLAKKLTNCVFDRPDGLGFVARAVGNVNWIEALERLIGVLDDGTAITWVNLAGTKLGSKGVAQLLELPGMASVSHLGLSRTNVTKAGLQALAKTDIPSLDLSHNKIGASLGALSGMKSLALLQLRWTGTTAKSFKALAKADLPELRRLELRAASVYVTPEQLAREAKYAEGIDATPEYSSADLAALVDSDLGARLTGLSLAENRLDGEAGSVLARLPRLERLNLSSTRIGWAGLAQLCEGLPALQVLDVQQALDQVAPPGGVLPALGRAPFHSTLQRLVLDYGKLGDAGLQTLLDGTKVTDLTLLHCELTDAGADWLGQRPGLSRVRVGHNQITPDGVAGLVAGAAAPTLELIGLGGQPVGDAGVDALLGASLPALRHLDLSGIGLTDAGLARLLAHPLASQLETLELRGNRLSNASAERLLEQATHLKRLTVEHNGFKVNAVLTGRLERAFPGLKVGRQNPGVLPPGLVEGWGGVRFVPVTGDGDAPPRDPPAVATPADPTVKIDGKRILVDGEEIGVAEYKARGAVRIGDTVLASVSSEMWESRLDVYVRRGGTWSRTHRIDCGWFGKHLVPMLEGELVAVVSGSQKRLAFLAVRDGEVRDLGRFDGNVPRIGPETIKVLGAPHLYRLELDEAVLDEAFATGSMPESLPLGIEPTGVSSHTRHWP